MLSDFGISRSFADATTTQTIAGTPVVVAPETFSASGMVGPAADQYSLAVTVFHSVEGRWPFKLNDFSAAAATMRDSPLEFQSHALPQAARTALARAMAADAAARFPSCSAFAAAFGGEDGPPKGRLRVVFRGR
jgi:eukaryotic-like serine/threonine-protein kinase